MTKSSAEAKSQFAVLPHGSEFQQRGQTYRVVGEKPHVTRDGRVLSLTVLRSCCADCGAEFDFGVLSPQPYLSRRCKIHAKPGARA